jgi:hypothetical protein
MYKFKSEHYTLGERVCICGLTNHQKVPHLKKVRKSNKLFMSANLRFADLICGPPTFDYVSFLSSLLKIYSRTAQYLQLPVAFFSVIVPAMYIVQHL